MITDIYEEDGKLYWPDTQIGSELDYGIDWSLWLTNEGDDFVSMTWETIPAGLTSAYNNDSANISLINLVAVTAGTYCISGLMESAESGHSQTLPIQIHLKVTELC